MPRTIDEMRQLVHDGVREAQERTAHDLSDVLAGVYRSYEQHVPTEDEYQAEDPEEREVIIEHLARELHLNGHQDALAELVELAMPLVLRHYA